MYHYRKSGAVINGPNYKEAGVDVDAGQALVRAIAPLTRATNRPGVMSEIGGFGGLFDPKAAGFIDPVLVAATDGVGTKLRIALETGIHNTVGIDLVAMCVNDLVVQGAEPLFFLDYFATGRLDPARGADVVAGIAEGCSEAGCALIGGETAEMPGMYAGEDYDLAGFAVGAAERDAILTGDGVSEGDVLIGIASSGLHSNGFSLVRRVVDNLGLAYASDAPFGDGTLGQSLLTPTRIYVRPCLELHRKGLLKALAHITGGGFPENVERILPDHLAAEIDAAGWAKPDVFRWLHKDGGVPAAEMLATFNCGIGMVAAVSSSNADVTLAALADMGETAWRIGGIVDRTPQLPAVQLLNVEDAWRG